MSHAVTIPVQLPGAVIAQRTLVNRYETGRLLRLYDTWLLLKSLTSSGHICQYKKQVDDLAAFCKVSRSTFYNRLRDLQALKLLRKEGENLVLASYADACAQLDIDHKEKTTVYYDPNNAAGLQHLLKALEIRQNQVRQTTALLQKLQSNSDLKAELTEMLVLAGCSRERLREPEYFRAKLHELQTELYKAGKEGFGAETVTIAQSLRADNNRSVRGIQAAWGCKSPQTVSYNKKKLFRLALISVEHVTVTTRKPTYCPNGTTKWFEGTQEKAWIMPDQITVSLPQRSTYARA